MKINLPQKFPQWVVNSQTEYTADVVSTRNVRVDELTTTGEIDNNTGLFLNTFLNSGYVPLAIFKDKNHYLSFATKNKLYYTDYYAGIANQYSPNLGSWLLNPRSSGVIMYPRGYPSVSITNFNSTGSYSTSGLTDFIDVNIRKVTYSYTAGRKVIGVRFYINYTQPSGQHISRMVIRDSNGDHIVTGQTSAQSGGYSYDYWALDGDANCNLNESTGFTALVQVATNGTGYPVNFLSGDSISILFENGDEQIIATAQDRLLNRAPFGGTDGFNSFFPGGSTNDGGIYWGYNSSFALDYFSPIILKLFNDKILMIGNGNSVHYLNSQGAYATQTISSIYSSTIRVTCGEFNVNRLQLPSGYVIKWIEVTPDIVYIGATQYKYPANETGKSAIFLWQPSSDRQETYELPEGENIGKVLNGFLYVLTQYGNIYLLYNGRFEFITKIYRTSENYIIQLPHINGVEIYKDSIAYLLPGNKYAPGGIYVFNPNTKNVYHLASVYFSAPIFASKDCGGNQPQIITGALKYVNENGEDTFFAGIDEVIVEDGNLVCGLFDSKNLMTNSIYNYSGLIETGRVKTQEVTHQPTALAIKYRTIADSRLIVSESKEENIKDFYDRTKIIYTGTWKSGENPNGFYIYYPTNIPSTFHKGMRITVLDGVLKGFTTIVTDIDWNNKLISIVPPYTLLVGNIASSNLIINPGSVTFTFLAETFGYIGTIQSSTTMTVSSSVASLLKPNQEIEFIAGASAGMVNYVDSINGITVTFKLPVVYDSNGTFTIFKINKNMLLYSEEIPAGTENWEIINGTLSPYSTDFVQYKISFVGLTRIRDIQVNVKPDLFISDDTRTK